MLTKTTRMSTVAAVLVATAIAAPSATAKPIETTLPAGINAGLGPSSGLATTAAPSAAGKLTPSFGLGAIAAASAGKIAAASASPPAAAPTSHSGEVDWGDAGIAAAGLLSLLGLGAGSVVLMRRSARAGQAVG